MKTPVSGGDVIYVPESYCCSSFSHGHGIFFFTLA